MDIRRFPDSSWVPEKLTARGWPKAREAVLTACTRNMDLRTGPMTSRRVAAVLDEALVGCVV